MQKWMLFLLFCFCLIFEPLKAQNDYRIVFYNVENLYDTFDDPNTEDFPFTSNGENHWTVKRLNRKLLLIYKAVIAGCKGQFPDVIGLAEIENYRVAEQLIAHTPFNKFPYEIIHKESPDPRGIDVALLYRKDRISPIDYEHIKISKKGKTNFVSREILHFTGEINGTRLHFFVNHWPSRSSGYNETKEYRNVTASILRTRIDSLLTSEPNARILLMGDFNASPNEACMTDYLNAHPYPGSNEERSLINLSTAWSKHGFGTVKRNGNWEIFDQIICTPNLLNSSGLYVIPSKTEICRASFLLEPDKRYLGNKPFRTYMGPIYHGGVSDHLPVVAVLSSGKY